MPRIPRVACLSACSKGSDVEPVIQDAIGRRAASGSRPPSESGRCLSPLGGLRQIALGNLSFNLHEITAEKIRDVFDVAPTRESTIQVKQLVFGPRLLAVTISLHRAGQWDLPVLTTKGNTPMGAAIAHGLQMLESQKLIYRNAGIPHYRPWVFLITDGGPTDSWQNAAHLVHEGEAKNKFQFFAVGVQGANFDILKQISVGEPIALKGLRFRDLFAWLSNSLSAVSQSKPGDEVKLENPVGPKGWGSNCLTSIWRWAGACSIGTSHIKAGLKCQDRAGCLTVETASGPIIVAVVSDGAGSAQEAALGASIVCMELHRRIGAYLRGGGALADVDAEHAAVWIDSIRDRISAAANAAGLRPRDYAATLVALLANDERTVVVHIGDGAAVMRDRETQEWSVPSWPFHGEYASTTRFVVDDPQPQFEIVHINSSIDRFAVFS